MTEQRRYCYWCGESAYDPATHGYMICARTWVCSGCGKIGMVGGYSASERGVREYDCCKECRA